jgi:tetratricopeptide (TPR) repeat protein
MTRTAKIGWAATFCIVLVALALGGIGLNFVLGCVRGRQLAEQGYAAMGHRDYDKAIEAFSAALKKPLGHFYCSYVLLNRGYALSTKSLFDQALTDYSEAIRINPELSSAHENRGWIYLRKGESDKALNDFSEAIKHNSNSATAYYQRGMIFYNGGKFDAALADFSELVRCAPNDSQGFVMRGRCYLNLNDTDRALSSFDAAVMINPRNSQALRERSCLYQMKGDYQHAVRDLADAELISRPIRTPKSKQRASADNLPGPLGGKLRLDVNPLPSLNKGNGDADFGSSAKKQSEKGYTEFAAEALVAYRRKDFDRAIELNDKALGFSVSAVDRAAALVNRGNVYRAKRQLDQALHDCAEAIKLNPHDPAGYIARAIVFTEQGESQKAMEDCDKALTIDPSRSEAYYYRGIDLTEQRKPDDAIRDFTRAIESWPESAGAYFYRARAHERKHEFENALGDYNVALALDPTAAIVYVHRAGVFMRLNKLPEARQDLESAKRIHGPDEWIGLNSIARFEATIPEPKLRDARDAVERATKACDLTQWADWRYLDTLAAAYAEAGDFDKAARFEQRALSMTNASTVRGKEARARLKLFQHHEPYRQKLE